MHLHQQLGHHPLCISRVNYWSAAPLDQFAECFVKELQKDCPGWGPCLQSPRDHSQVDALIAGNFLTEFVQSSFVKQDEVIELITKFAFGPHLESYFKCTVVAADRQIQGSVVLGLRTSP